MIFSKLSSYIQDKAVYMNVDISHCGFISKPVLVASVGGETEHATTVGSGNPYGVSASKFRLYVFDRDRDIYVTLEKAANKNWHINYHATGKIC